MKKIFITIFVISTIAISSILYIKVAFKNSITKSTKKLISSIENKNGENINEILTVVDSLAISQDSNSISLKELQDSILISN